MSTTYSVQPGDTLSKIARKHYGDTMLTTALGQFNGLANINLIFAGQVLEIPAASELADPPAKPAEPAPKSTLAPPMAGILKAPHGISAIIEVFGDAPAFKGSQGAWAKKILATAKLPAPLKQSWDGKKVSSFSCHTKLTGVFTDVFQAIHDRGHWDELRTFGGCYNYRLKRKSSSLSTHSWAIAVDLNPDTNGMGTTGDMSPAVVAIFREFGFKWGGDFKDPMHFQFCTGY